VRQDTTSPFWIETPLKRVDARELMNNLSFEIWDDDVDASDYIGGCKIPVTADMFDGSLRSHTCAASGSTVEVTVYFRLRQPG
jgi:hypothetical protein